MFVEQNDADTVICHLGKKPFRNLDHSQECLIFLIPVFFSFLFNVATLLTVNSRVTIALYLERIFWDFIVTMWNYHISNLKWHANGTLMASRACEYYRFHLNYQIDFFCLPRKKPIWKLQPVMCDLIYASRIYGCFILSRRE